MWQLAGLILEWLFTFLLILLWLFIRSVMVILRVFARFKWACRPLNTSFIIFLGCVGVSIVLLLAGVAQYPSLLNLAVSLGTLLSVVGFIQLAITAKVVELTNADLFMKESSTLAHQVLHTNWFSYP
jgi:hypothetical protein